MKFFIALFLIFNLLNAQEENQNVVKTSELELFLFKVGFESLLKDLEITKDKSKLNEEELRKLNDKVELIMNEIYKEKRVLKADSTQVVVNNQSDRSEILALKEEIELLKQEVNALKKSNIQVQKIEEKSDISSKYKIIVDLANIREEPTLSANIVDTLKKDDLIEIESCDKFDWCKLKDEKKYISKFLLGL